MTTSPQMRRVALASALGTSIEWYDFFIYTTASALVFNQLFFPTLSPVAGVLSAFATYAVGYIARPLGAVVFGHFGDRIGRKKSLVWTLLMMGIATFLVGLVPTHASIGNLAPLLLVVLRFVQGMAVGGEWGGAALLSVEHAPRERRTFFGAFAQIGSPVGLLLATSMFAVLNGTLSAEQFAAWGWRLPFLISIVLVVVGFVVRMKVAETPDFEQSAPRSDVLPIVQCLRTSWRQIVVGLGIFVGGFAAYYVLTTFMLAYTTTQLGLSRSTALAGQIVAAVVEAALMFVFASMGDRYGKGKVIAWGAVAGLLWAVPPFWLFGTGSALWLCVGVGVGLVGVTATYSVGAAYVAQLFAPRVRYTGMSLSYQLAGAIGGGLVPLFSTASLGWSGGHYWPVALVTAVFYAFTLICLRIGRAREQAAAIPAAQAAAL
ncbi:putative MFS family arabinose efflux permease [Nonomuraea fuscirosea]|uniref:Putative proline/betaine transporter n=1 Tax=Nonomuraea fuscirosea TaxID=1291556 RepID=A0A2T0MQK4_9ACTN|nr:MFS transporter [Nonomuraea fuscirosea]PRX60386.1 putative MFS family arabinose efflux permease [Nonomuraea fuscirosea]